MDSDTSAGIRILLRAFILVALPIAVFNLLGYPYFGAVYAVLFVGFHNWVSLYTGYTVPCNSNSKKLLFLIVQCLGFVLRRKVVVLQTWDNKIYISVANPIKGSSDLESHVYFISKITPLRLRYDGSVLTANGKPTYILHWLPLNEKDRIFKILQGNVGFDF